jgi:TRAP-type uncharacterized transport system substrate-binding protein
MFKQFSAIAAVLAICGAVFFSTNTASAQEYGVVAKRPLIGAACNYCPWGALAEKVKAAMAPLGYDVQVCYNCSRADSIRIVSEARVPPPLTPRERGEGRPQAPNVPVDFGAVSVDIMHAGYHGIGLYESEGPRDNLRLIAKIESPTYYLVATRGEAQISDLAQIRERKLPVRIHADRRAEPILEYYGITKEELESWGGILTGPGDQDRLAFDVILHFASSLNNTPESNIWYEASQKMSLRFLELPDEAWEEFLENEGWDMGEAPVRLFRGMEEAVRVAVSSGHVVYTRAEIADDFAYDVAKALDESRQNLIYSLIPFSYDPNEAWKARDVPLHPGAERYYREKGYMN